MRIRSKFGAQPPRSSHGNIRVCDFDFRSAALNPERLHINIVEVFEEKSVCVRWSSRGVNLVLEERRFGERSLHNGGRRRWRALPGKLKVKLFGERGTWDGDIRTQCSGIGLRGTNPCHGSPCHARLKPRDGGPVSASNCDGQHVSAERLTGFLISVQDAPPSTAGWVVHFRNTVDLGHIHQAFHISQFVHSSLESP